MVGESESGEEVHHQQRSDDGVVGPVLPAGIGPEAPGKEEEDEQRRVEGDQVADEVKGLVDEEAVADDRESGEELEERY